MTLVDLARNRHVSETVSVALGREHRHDPVLARTGGPAGNAVLTAWTGLVLLVLGVAELLTLINIRGLISWHVAVGALLIPPALAKTASTGWRIVRYYRASPAYAEAGPPPLPHPDSASTCRSCGRAGTGRNARFPPPYRRAQTTDV